MSGSAAPVDHHQLFAHPANFLALGFGAGLSRYAPGTVGSLIALPFFLLMLWANPIFYLSIVVLLFIIGVWCCGQSANLLGVHDHPAIVWDEIVGMLITLFLIPATPVYLLIGFLLFRFFDIVKPWPIGWVDRRVDGGMGIMLDDVIAGLMSLAVLQILYRWLLPAVGVSIG